MIGTPTGVLDIEDRATWDKGVTDLVAAIIENGVEIQEAEEAGDIRLKDHEAAELVEMTALMPIAMYHGTRMTEGEREAVGAIGLLPLSAMLVEERVQHAVDGGLIDPDLASEMVRRGVADARLPHRGDQVCFSTARSSLRNRPGFRHLLGTWGGEALYGNWPNDGPEREGLRQIGEPTIVRVAVVLTPDRVRYTNFDIGRSLVRAGLGLRAPGAVFIDRVVPEEVLGIFTPGDPEWADLEPLSEK